MAFSKLQQGTDNKQLQGSQSTMTGNATGGATKGGSAAGTPGGFTNIQDYMQANAGDKTNQNYLNTKADEQLSNAKGQLNSQVGALSQINQNPAADMNGLQNILQSNDYATAEKYGTNKEFKPTSQEFSPITDPTAKLNGSLSSIMDYMGGIKPISQDYTQGMQGFDEMLLGGDKGFSDKFSTDKKIAFQNEVANPYGEAVKARDNEKKTYADTTKGWQDKMNEYLTGQKGKVASKAQEQITQGTKPQLNEMQFEKNLQSKNSAYYNQLKDIQAAYDLFNRAREEEQTSGEFDIDQSQVDWASNILSSAGLVNDGYDLTGGTTSQGYQGYRRGDNVLKANPYEDLKNNYQNYYDIIGPTANENTAYTYLNSADNGDFGNDYNAIANILGIPQASYQNEQYKPGSYKFKNLPIFNNMNFGSDLSF